MRWLAAVVVMVAVSAGCGDRTAGDAGDADGAAEWQRLPDGPLSGRTGAVMVGVGDRAYVFGGWEFLCPPMADCYPDSPTLADGAVLDTATGAWEPIADAPYGVRDAATTVLGEDIYVAISCRGKAGCHDGPLDLLRYDTAEDRWHALGTVPGGEGVHRSLHVIAGRVLALSTSDESGEVSDVLYDPVGKKWTVLPDDPLPRSYDRFAVADGNRLLVFGSPMVGPEEESGPKGAAAFDLDTGGWARLPDAPDSGFQVWRSGGRAFLNPHFGPDGGAVLDLRTDTWQPLPADLRRDDRYDFAGLIGAEVATYEYSDGWAVDARDDSFVQIPKRPTTAYDESRTAVGQDLLVFGGQDWGGSEEADGDGRLVSETWLWSPPQK